MKLNSPGQRSKQSNSFELSKIEEESPSVNSKINIDAETSYENSVMRNSYGSLPSLTDSEEEIKERKSSVF